MANGLHRLSARQVETMTKPGRHADGGNLYLRITSHGSKSYSFLATYGGERREIGLGSTKSLSLAAARKLAAAMREAVALGEDPRSIITPSEPEPVAPTVTFGEFAISYVADIEGGWKNPVHRKQWRQSLRDHATPIWKMPIDEIQTEHVLDCLKPIWLEKCETASRVRGRIERVLDAAKVKGLRPIDAINPAQWKGHLQLLLPKQPKFARGHHKALAWKQAPSFMAELRQRSAEAARALEFTILTAARSGEVLGATWSEIDFDEALWRIPAERMKAGVEHLVPLSSAAMEVLRRQWTRDGGANEPLPSDAVFGVRGAHRSNMAMNQLLKRMGYEGKATTHGFRSTFRDWAGDATDYPREVIEQALAHTIGNKAEAAYRRGTALEKRRRLMEEWAEYLGAG